MDGPAGLGLHLGLVVDGLAQQVEHPAQAFIAHGHGDGGTGILRLGAPLKPIGGGHGDAAHHIVADVLGHLGGDGAVAVFHQDCAEQLWQLVIRKPNIQNRTHYLDDCSLVICH